VASFLSYLPAAFAIAAKLATYEAEFAAGVPAVVDPIRTYIGKQHIEIDITVRQLDVAALPPVLAPTPIV
jgi:hypothetical protein